MRLPFGSAIPLSALALALAASSGCRQPLSLTPRVVAPDKVLIFEQRVASPNAESGPDWESWQLYESGRFVYARASTEPTRRRVGKAQLAAVHAWLRSHDFELTRNTPESPAPSAREISATCQLQLSLGLVLAPFGDRRYYACDELKKLSLAR